MAFIDLTFNSMDISANVGDTIYFSNPTTSDGFLSSSDKTEIGAIESINTTGEEVVIKVNCSATIDTSGLTLNSFIFFSKDNVVNMSSLKGYYGLVEFKNDSNSAIELFSVGCDITESSK